MLKKNYFARFLFFCAVAICASFSAQAQQESNASRITELEIQLEESMRLIRSMSAELDRLKADVQFKDQNTKASPDSEINERLEELEIVLEEVSDRIGNRAIAQAFEATSLDIGGFLHSVFTQVDGEDGSASAFNRQIFEILVRSQISEDWSAFIAQAFIRQSEILYDDNGDGIADSAGGRRNPFFSMGSASPLVIAWANYTISDELDLQFGRFITPHGIINIDHFPAALLDPEQPQFLRPFSGQTIFPNFVDGIHIYGNHYLGETENYFSYNLYVSNFVGNTDDFLFGGRLSHTWSEPGITLGFNIAKGEREAARDSDYTMVGLDFLFDNGPLLWKSEIFATNEELNNDRFSFYTQPAWRFSPKWLVFYRYDYLDNGGSAGDSVENVVGVNYLPYPNVRIRGILTHHEFESGVLEDSADALIYHVSATLSF